MKGYVQGGLRSGQDCPLTQKVRTQAESSKPVSVHIHLTHDDSEFLNSGETWTFFSSVIITFSLVRKVPSLRLGLGVTPSRITQDTTMPKLVAPQSRRKSECTVNIYSFCGFRPTDAVFSHLFEISCGHPKVSTYFINVGLNLGWSGGNAVGYTLLLHAITHTIINHRAGKR